MGRLNNGFTFFNDNNYSISAVVKNRSIQGIELFVHDYDKMLVVHIKIPIIHEEKITKKGIWINYLPPLKFLNRCLMSKLTRKKQRKEKAETKTKAIKAITKFKKH